MQPIIKIPPSLQHRKFALFWGGSLISVAGTQMQVWALLWHVSVLDNQPIVVSGIGLARFLPILLFSLFGGLVADQFNRRRILFATQTVMMLSALALGVLTVSGTIQVWHIYLLTGVQAMAGSFDTPARQALIPNLIPRELFANAFSLNSISFNTGAILGPALSGIIIATLGLQWVYFINAASYLAVILALALVGDIPQEEITTEGSITASARGRATNLAAIREGIQFITRHPIILSSMLLDFWATFFSSANTLLPFVAKNVLHVGVQEYGWLSAGQSIGAVSVGILFSQRVAIRRQGKLLLGAVIAFGFATILFGLSRYFLLTLLALVLVGSADSVSTILRNTIRQLQTPDYIRGRMVSINQMFFAGGPQLGEVELGIVGQTFGVPAAIITGGAGCILAAFLIALIWPPLLNYDNEKPAAQA